MTLTDYIQLVFGAPARRRENLLILAQSERIRACTHESGTPVSLAMSALPSEADIRVSLKHVCFVPAGDTPLNARYVRTDSRECVARV
jgi:hypothetical protein